MTIVTLLLLLVIGAVTLKLYVRYQRIRVKELRREREPAIFHVNPRKGRIHLRQPIQRNLRRASWMIAQNNPRVNDNIREYCEVLGVDNSCSYLDTSKLWDTTGGSARRLLLRAKQKIFSESSLFSMIARNDLKKESVLINRVLNKVRCRRNRSYKLLIKFIRKEGEVDPHENKSPRLIHRCK
jgi:hypothetical protein